MSQGRYVLLCLVLLAFCAYLIGCGGAGGPSMSPDSAPAEAPRHTPPQVGLESLYSEVHPRETSPHFNTEAYDFISENRFVNAAITPLSTFSIDVDTASYSNVRRFLSQGRWPPPGAVRIEELINYFRYDYPQPHGDMPFSVTTEVAACPWQPDHKLVLIGLKGRDIDTDARPLSNLVFLLDVSGSMQARNKLTLVKKAMRLLVKQLGENDQVAIVVYAGASGRVLDPTPGYQKGVILRAIDRLQAGGSTHGSSGIRLAYDTARANFIRGGVNRVILCTDGDFNVGITNQSQLLRLIQREAETGVFLSVLGFGTGNLKDSTMELLADNGNGNYGYVDNVHEARKVFVDELSGTLVTIAKDVKLQIDFNTARTAAYRLIGYENRMLAAEDFRDDRKDAGDIGAGHTVTALYEVVPQGVRVPGADVEPSKYQTTPRPTRESRGKGILTVRLRYKEPDGDRSRLLKVLAFDSEAGFRESSDNLRFAASVASFGMLLRNSEFKGDADLDDVRRIASASLGADRRGYRADFLHLVREAGRIGER